MQQCANSTDVDSINVSLDPELRVRLFNGDINIFRCESCDITVKIEKDLLYHDQVRKFGIKYVPPYWLDYSESFKYFSTDGKYRLDFDAGDMFQEKANYLFDAHVVFDLNEMLRYITFRELLWERDCGEGEQNLEESD